MAGVCTLPSWPKKAGQLEPRSLIFGGAAIIFRIALKTNGCRLGALPLCCLSGDWSNLDKSLATWKKKVENLAMFELWESYLLLLCARTEPLHFQKEPNLHWLYFRIESWLPDSENKTRRGVVWSVIAVRRTRSARAETKIVQVCPAPAYPATNFKDRRIMSVFELNLSTFCY